MHRSLHHQCQKKFFLGQSSSNSHKLPSLPLLWPSPAVVSAIEPVPVLKLGPRFPPADKHLSSADPTYPKLKKKIQSSPEKVVVSVELFVIFPFLAQIHLEIIMIINFFYLLRSGFIIRAIIVVRAINITIMIIIFVVVMMIGNTTLGLFNSGLPSLPILGAPIQKQTM